MQAPRDSAGLSLVRAFSACFRFLTSGSALARNVLFEAGEEESMLSLLGALWIFAVFVLAARHEGHRLRRESRGWRSRRAYAI